MKFDNKIFWDGIFTFLTVVITCIALVCTNMHANKSETISKEAYNIEKNNFQNEQQNRNVSSWIESNGENNGKTELHISINNNSQVPAYNMFVVVKKFGNGYIVNSSNYYKQLMTVKPGKTDDLLFDFDKNEILNDQKTISEYYTLITFKDNDNKYWVLDQQKSGKPQKLNNVNNDKEYYDYLYKTYRIYPQIK
ncbi:hypothetical protein [Limosilactobacillus reuteri]|uniref:hypothetical protein n=1 Tax=Limosilactobacillus reuteri TaxID=1598 RepID=UPI001C3FF2F3|nr:hypothetical protein [Limosilactobacillus reuteri]